MEALEIANVTWNNEIGYLVVRSICNYSDSHKMMIVNSMWLLLLRFILGL
jgi:nucleoside phosphorylase